jgi:hypothetical protein
LSTSFWAVNAFFLHPYWLEKNTPFWSAIRHSTAFLCVWDNNHHTRGHVLPHPPMIHQMAQKTVSFLQLWSALISKHLGGIVKIKAKIAEKTVKFCCTRCLAHMKVHLMMMIASRSKI